MDFQEDFLHTVWKYQYFNKQGLNTTEGQPIEIKKIGYHNSHDGPDFLEAHIRIGNLDHVGNVEIHRRASDWHAHAHERDPRYQTVVLHVVWEEDQPISHTDKSRIPTLELKGRVWLDVLRNYERLLQGQQELLCGQLLPEVPEIIRFSMLEKALVERMEKKSQAILLLLKETQNDWEETACRWLFACFGFKTNAEPMLQVAKSVPYKTLQKLGQAEAIEAILLGQAGLLPENLEDSYSQRLRKEYDFYQHKYRLPFALSSQVWKTKGVRPGNFPALRLVQLAQILSSNPHLFSSILSLEEDYNGFSRIFKIQMPDYWQTHYRPGEVSIKKLSKGLSKSSLDLLMINFVCPLWAAYGVYVKEEKWKQKCLDLLEQLPKENNYIIRKFQAEGWEAQHAADTQGMIGLYQEYCQRKRCLDCKVGQQLLKPQKKPC